MKQLKTQITNRDYQDVLKRTKKGEMFTKVCADLGLDYKALMKFRWKKRGWAVRSEDSVDSERRYHAAIADILRGMSLPIAARKHNFNYHALYARILRNKPVGVSTSSRKNKSK